MRTFNVPLHSPLYPNPPYFYEDFKKISVICEVETKNLVEIIPEPLELGDTNTIEIYVMSTEKNTLGPFKEGGVVIPVKYKDTIGGTIAYMYVTSDAALCCGREIWGYPKKIADIAFEENGGEIKGNVNREGIDIISVSCKLNGKEIEMPKLYPRFLVRIIPKVDGPGIESKKVVLVEAESKDIQVRTGEAFLKLGHSSVDPIYKIEPINIIGAIYTSCKLHLPYGKELR